MKHLPLFATNYYDYYTTLEGNSYHITIKWNSTDEAWYLDLIGVSNDVAFQGIKLVGGIDLLEPYRILELGQLYIVDMQSENQDPNFEDVGDRYRLCYLEIGETL